MPEGADAVVQIEDTERLPASSSGQAKVRIVKVLPQQPLWLALIAHRSAAHCACCTKPANTA